MVFPFSHSLLSLFSVVAGFLSLASSLASPAYSPGERIGIYPRQSTDSTACQQIFSSYAPVFPATLAYECLISVPFNRTVATQFLQYYKDTLKFQSTLAYLKNPPPSYQQPAIDLLAGLDLIQRQINTGVFHNEYAFEAALQNLIYATHDGHIELYAGALNVFRFQSPLPIVSVSADGFALPKVFITSDLLTAQGANVDWAPSAIATINGQEVTDYLTQFAALTSQGFLEPHADWNELMSSPAADIQGSYNAFTGSSPFYPGDLIEFTFENGTNTYPTPWLATYSIPANTPIINTGKDFYDFFVLGIFPSSDDGSSAASSTVPAAASSTTYATAAATTTDTSYPTSSPTADAAPVPSSWGNAAYPDSPDVFQPNLGLSGGGVITGYFLNDSSTAVLSIPSFELTGEAIGSFSATIGEFLSRSQEAGLTKVVIDLQQNGGGDSLLATDTFKQFFPSIDPFGGGRLRAFDTANTLGNTYTTYYDTQPMNASFYDAMSADVWTATDYLDASTGMNFSSWAEYFGPHPDNGDFFTTTQRDNLSSIIYDDEALGIVVYGFANNSALLPQPYSADDIVILTDAYCSSTCAVFVEMMHHEAGVKTVVVGGRPEIGPMQAVGGVRGSQSYASQDIDSDILNALYLNSSVADYLPDRDVSLWITYAQFNLRDQIREDEYFPLQFAYEAANCRIFFTAETFYNYTNLWLYAANAMWYNPALCVPGSTDQPSTNSTDTMGPTAAQKATWAATGPQTPQLNASSMGSDYTTAELTGLVGDFTFHDEITSLDQPCSQDGKCLLSNEVCMEVEFCSNNKLVKQKQCKQTCRKSAECGNSQKLFFCNTQEILCTKSGCVNKGFCAPTRPRSDVKCKVTAPKLSPTLAAGIGSIVLDLSTPAPKPPAKPPAKPPKHAGKTKDEYLEDGTLGGAIRAGMAPWE